MTAPPQHSYEGLNTPRVWRSARSQAAANVDALASNGMDQIGIPAPFAEAPGRSHKPRNLAKSVTVE